MSPQCDIITNKHPYRCSAGFYLYSIKDNPLQNLTCQGSRKVDFDSVITELCVREYQSF